MPPKFYLPAVISERWIPWLLRNERWWLYLALPLISLAMHWTILGKDLQGMHVWRQTGTQQTIDCFVEEDMNILNPRRMERGTTDGISRVEFPLYQWLAAVLAKIFGNTVLLTRLFTFFLGCLGIWAMRNLVLELCQDRLAGLIGAFLFAFAPVVYYYMVCTLPDTLALVSAMWGLVFLLRQGDSIHWRMAISAAVLLGIAVLVKLPYIVFFPAFGVWVLQGLTRKNAKKWRNALFLLAIALISLVPAAAWYAWVIPTWGSSGALSGIFFHLADTAEIGAIVRYHLTEMLPRTVINVAALPLLFWGAIQFIRRKGIIQLKRPKFWLLASVAASFFVYYAYEIWLISYHHDYYLLGLVPFWVLVAAIGASEALQSRRMVLFALAFLLLLLAPYMTYRRIHPRWQDQNAEMNLDFSKYKNELRAAVPAEALVVMGTDESRCIVPYYIHKKGWGWTKSQGLKPEKLEEWITQGATYMYCDDRKVDQNPKIRAMLGPEVGRWGSVWVYSLQK